MEACRVVTTVCTGRLYASTAPRWGTLRADVLMPGLSRRLSAGSEPRDGRTSVMTTEAFSGDRLSLRRSLAMASNGMLSGRSPGELMRQRIKCSHAGLMLLDLQLVTLPTRHHYDLSRATCSLP